MFEDENRKYDTVTGSEDGQMAGGPIHRETGNDGAAQPGDGSMYRQTSVEPDASKTYQAAGAESDASGTYQQNRVEPDGQNGYWRSDAQADTWNSYQTGDDARRTNAASDGWDSSRQRSGMSYIPDDRPKKERSSHSTGAKIAGVAAAAVLFGVLAGGTMFGVNTIGEYVKGRYVASAETETEPVTIARAETQGVPDESTPAVASANPAILLDVSSIVEKAMSSVVAINNTMTYEQRNWFGQSQTVEVPSSGSGIIVGQNDDELLIVTNNHVVADSSELTVTFIDDEQVSALIKGTDSDSDLAVIAVQLSDISAETMSQIKIATLGDSDEMKVGQGVIAIGNALGYGQSVTVGCISALNREVQTDESTTKNLLQTDAAINPGNSGGALLNMNGEVIGINAAKYSSTSVEGMGYAIPISQAEDIINELMNKKTRVLVDEAEQGYLGIQGQNIDETAAQMYDMPRGIYVYKIVEDSAASASDLREKDIITKFDGQSVKTMAELKEMLTYYKGGDTVDLTVQSLENGEYVERTVSITLGTKPAAEVN